MFLGKLAIVVAGHILSTGVCAVPPPWGVPSGLKSRERCAPPGALVGVSVRSLIQTLCCVATIHITRVPCTQKSRPVSWGCELT